MTSDLAQWMGYLAAGQTTGSFIPQAVHAFRSPSLAGISLSMYAAFTLGVLLWLAYGVLLGAWPIIIANLLTLALAGTILLRTLVQRRRARPHWQGAIAERLNAAGRAGASERQRDEQVDGPHAEQIVPRVAQPAVAGPQVVGVGGAGHQPAIVGAAAVL